MKRLKRWALRLGVLFALLGVFAFGMLNFLTYRADDVAQAILAETGVEATRQLIILEPAEPLGNVVIYQGGLVETEAYLVFASLLRDKGYRVFLPKMPLNLAILRRDALLDIRGQYPSALPWIAVGHSLGGATLSFIADAQHMDAWVLLGAYPAQSVDLTALTIPVVSMTASQDTILNEDQFTATRQHLPKQTVFIEIEGGNHAQFAHYGAQRGDGQATISRAQQQHRVIEVIQNLLISD